jgi:hypothetical protein
VTTVATLLELAKIKHHAVRSDGAKFLDGERNDALDTSWLTVNSGGRVTLGPGLYDELLVVKGEVSDDQIKAWANMGAPFYDPTPVIQENQIPSAEEWNRKARTFYQASAPTGEFTQGDVWFDTSNYNRRHWWDGSKWVDAEDVSPIDASQRPVTARGLGGVIEMDHEGMRFVRKADGKIVMQLDIETGSGFYDGVLAAARVMAALAEFGEIVTDEITIKSADGRTTIIGNTMEVKDENNVVRVRIGRLS